MSQEFAQNYNSVIQEKYFSLDLNITFFFYWGKDSVVTIVTGIINNNHLVIRLVSTPFLSVTHTLSSHVQILQSGFSLAAVMGNMICVSIWSISPVGI